MVFVSTGAAVNDLSGSKLVVIIIAVANIAALVQNPKQTCDDNGMSVARNRSSVILSGITMVC
jgi:hypothetical protein